MALARCHLVITDESGNVQDGCSVDVRREAAGFPLEPVFSDRSGLVALGNPFVAADGADAGFHAAGGAFKITASKTGFTRTWRYVGIGLATETDYDGVVDLENDPLLGVLPAQYGGINPWELDAGQWTGSIKHVFAGDSRTIGSVGTAWPSKLIDHMAEYVSADVHNFAIGGQTLAAAYANYNATVGTVLPDKTAGEVAYLYLVCAGQINDYVVGDGSSPVNPILAAASFATLQAFVARGIADGFRVIIGTEPKAGSLDATGETNRVTFNNLILAWHTAPYRLARLDLLFTDVTDAADFIDAPTGAHFTADAASRVAAEVTRVIAGHQPLIYPTGRNSRVIGKLGIGIKAEPTYTLDLAGNSTTGYPVIAITDLDSGGKQFLLYGRGGGTAGKFRLYNQTDGSVRFDSTETTFEIPGQNLLIGTSATTGTSTATPKYIDLGDTYSNAGGANPKLKLYHSTSGTIGLGVSSAGIDFIGTGISYTFYNNTTVVATIGTAGLQLTSGATVSIIDTDGTLAANSDTRLATQKAVKTYADGLAGAFVAASQAEQEAASSTTKGVTPGRQHFHPSAVKAWGMANQTGTQALLASYNVTSITDGGAGVTTFTWTNAMSSASYEVSTGVNISTVNVGGETARAAGSFTITCTNAGTPTDSPMVHVSACGDL